MPTKDPLADTTIEELTAGGDRSLVADAKATDKKNYAEVLSRMLAIRFANLLRPAFPNVVRSFR